MKKSGPKLTLRKETIRALIDKDLARVAAGNGALEVAAESQEKQCTLLAVVAR
jgi:hypothetical protein